VRSAAGQDACDWIRLAAERGGVAASCSGVLLLAQAGVLDGRSATTSPMTAPLMRTHFPQVRLDPSQTVIQDGPVTTGGAPLAQIDVMLSLIARSGGGALADACGHRLAADGPGGSRYTPLGFYTCRDPAIAQAEAWVRERLDQPICVETMASDLGFSPRTLARRMDRTIGLTPIRFVQRLRLESAVQLLRRTRLPVDEIARRVGYAEASTLRRVMAREMSLSPAELRAGGPCRMDAPVKSALTIV
jgi:transcriptional regulator GlxA family with amidase domain